MSREWQRIGKRTEKGEEIYRNVITRELACEFDNRYLVPYRDKKEVSG